MWPEWTIGRCTRPSRPACRTSGCRAERLSAATVKSTARGRTAFARPFLDGLHANLAPCSWRLFIRVVGVLKRRPRLGTVKTRLGESRAGRSVFAEGWLPLTTGAESRLEVRVKLWSLVHIVCRGFARGQHNLGHRRLRTARFPAKSWLRAAIENSRTTRTRPRLESTRRRPPTFSERGPRSSRRPRIRP